MAPAQEAVRVLPIAAINQFDLAIAETATEPMAKANKGIGNDIANRNAAGLSGS
jgi:hypothetical protein